MGIRRQAAVAAAVVTSVLAFPLASAQASTISVNTSRDVVADDGRCSLREAIAAADGNAASGSKRGECLAGAAGPFDTITLARDTTYRLTRLPANDDTNVGGDLDIAHEILIKGRGGSVIRQKQQDRVFDILSTAAVTLDRVVVTGGHAPDGQPAAGFLEGAAGGGIRNQGAMTVTRSTVTANTSGAGSNTADQAGNGGIGGGIYNASAGFLNVISSRVTGNLTGKGGDSPGRDPGGNFGVSAGSGGSGAGIANEGLLLLDRTRVSGNRGGKGGAGKDDVVASKRGLPGLGGTAGAIYMREAAARTTITSSTISRNVAGRGGDAVESTANPVQNGGIGFGGGGAGAIFAEDGELTIDKSTISSNAAGAGSPGGRGASYSGLPGTDGGAGGKGGDVGGIWYLASVPMTITASTLSGNRAGTGGSGGPGGVGTTRGAQGSRGEDGLGGAIGYAVVGDSVVVKNSTISGNKARQGGGLFIVNGNVTFNNVTVARNVATDRGGGIYDEGGTGFAIRNSLIGTNAAPIGPDCDNLSAGSFTSGGSNLVQRYSGTTCAGFGGGDVLDVSPRIARLDFYGGPTKTHALRAGSPAIDAGNDGLCEPTDQRGKTRSDCDIGAFER